MALEIRAFDPGKATGYCVLIFPNINTRAARTHVRELANLTDVYERTRLIADHLLPHFTIEVCFEDWRTFPSGPPYSKVIAKEVIGVIKIACIHAGIGWRGYMPATKSLIQDKHLKALDLWHSSKHIRDATKIALVHLHKLHRELFDAIMKEVL